MIRYAFPKSHCVVLVNIVIVRIPSWNLGKDLGRGVRSRARRSWHLPRCSLQMLGWRIGGVSSIDFIIIALLKELP